MTNENSSSANSNEQVPRAAGNEPSAAETAPEKQLPSRRVTPRQARLERRKHQRRKRTGTVISFILVAVFALVALGYIECIQSTPGPSDDVTKGIVLGPVASGKYKDDVTEGRSKRWSVRVRVRVRFFHGKIDNIEILQHRSIWPKAKRAAAAIVSEIIAKQNSRVKAVSGATLSSQAIMLAVQDALTNNQKKNKWDVHRQTGEGGRWDDKY